MNRRHAVTVGLVIVVLAGLLTACGPAATPAMEGYKSYEPAPPPVAPSPAPDRARAPAAADASQTIEQQIERMVIQTAYLTLIVEDVEIVLPQVNDLVRRMEGYIVQSSSYRTATDRLAASVTLRVPAERFDETLAQIRAMAGKVQEETLSGEDVTDQYVDLQSRLRALQATENELLALLGEVRQSEGNAQEKAQAILDIYNRLTEVRSQIEQIQGRLNYLEQMAAMATITVQLLPRDPEIPQPVIEEGFAPLRTLQRAARALVDILQWLLNALIWILVVVLPVLVLLALPFVLLVWLLRRRRKRNA